MKFIRHDGKSKLKGHIFGFLEKDIDCNQVIPIVGNKSTYVVKINWERILPLKNNGNFKT